MTNWQALDIEREFAAFPERAPSSLPPLEWQALDLAELWQALCSGSWRFQELFDSEARCYAVLEPVAPASARPVPIRSANILGRLLLGQCHKAVGFEIRRSAATIATAAHQALQAMGLKGLGSRAPVLLAMAACAALRPRRTPVLARCTRVGKEEDASLLVSMARPDVRFPASLSVGEAAVIRQLIGGATHAEIARGRGTSSRTVANQLATAFQKLRVSGRAALTAHLILVSPEFCESTEDESESSMRPVASEASFSKGFSQSGAVLGLGLATLRR